MDLASENEALRAQLTEAQEVIRAIQSGDVDAVVVSGAQGEQRIFTLKGAEYAYRALVEAMNEGAATLGADGIVLYCNQRLSSLLGIPLEQIIGHPAAQLAGDKSKDDFENLFARALSGEAAKCELELQPFGGRNLPVYLSLGEMKGDDPTAICMVVTDLTEQKKREELLAAEEILRKQAELLKLSYDAIIMWRPDKGIEGWNIGAELLYGYSEKEVLGQVTHDLLATVFPKPWPEIEAELRKKGFWEGELRHYARDGRQIVVSARKQLIQDTDGSNCVLEINRDITERKRAEEVLRQSELRFRALFESSLDAVLLMAPNGQISAANPAACAVFGMSEAEICSVDRHELIDPDDQRHAAALESQRTEGLVRAELNYVRRNGQKFTAEVDSIILSSNPPSSFVILRDITDRKRAEQALIQSEKLASVGRMASTIAHEINNPLETIGHAIYLAMTDPGTSAQAKSYLDLAVQEMERVTHITRQTLSFYRENKRPTLIDLRENIDGLLRLFTPRLKSRGIVVEKRYAEVEPILATGGEVQQVASNLLSNSMDAMTRQGKIQLRISRAIGRNAAQGVRLTVADSGSGIPPERLKKIFEPFFTTKEVVGTGLGLWISKQIIDKHGATIRVRSKPGKGTVFSIVFPIARPVQQRESDSDCQERRNSDCR